MLGSDSQFSSTFVERFWHNPHSGPYPSDRPLFNSSFFFFLGSALCVWTFTAGDAVNAGVDRKSGREEAEAYLGGAKRTSFASWWYHWCLLGCHCRIRTRKPSKTFQVVSSRKFAQFWSLVSLLLWWHQVVALPGTVPSSVVGWARLSIKWVGSIWRFPQQCGYFIVPPNHPSQIH